MSRSDVAAALVAAAGMFAVLFGGTLGRRRWHHGLGIALDLWLAAVLVRLLLADASWVDIAAAALVVALRPLLRDAVQPPARPTLARPPSTP